ncbi:MAG: protein kinase [Bryobacteraceae bacterium]
MSIAAGDKLSHYEILAPIGAGGMGEVYKARDTRLDRFVAIKVLPEHIANRDDLKARFEREARAVASLNHPHICVLYDIGVERGVQYMALEYLEGETLDARLGRGALPLDTALQYAMQIADALDRAHRAGVAHRDIKPGNLMLTRDGVKVLDFGLAKSKARPGPTEATLVASLTSEGTVLGTPQYMSPELFEGKEADPRADVWAFGSVLYEMVTGRKAFDGKSYSTLVGAILSADPLPLTPQWLERITRRCLQKDPEDRYQSIRDVLLDLRAGGREPEPKITTARPWLAWSVAAIGIVAAVLLGSLHLRQQQPDVHTASLVPPPNMDFGEIAVSPNGKLVAFTGLEGSKRQLYVRSLDSMKAQPLPGTEAAESPFWSPDSQSLAFFARGKLKRTAVAGGSVQTVCDAPSTRGGTWNENGWILFSDRLSTIVRVPDQGGEPVQVKIQGTFQSNSRDRWPYFLPGGKAFLHTRVSPARTEDTGIYWTELDSGKTKRLLSDHSNAAYTENRAGKGFLLFVRENALMAQPLSANTGDWQGPAFPLADKAAFLILLSEGRFSASANGLLVYASTSGDTRQLTWLSRSGEQISTFGKPDQVRRPALAPDGHRVAYDIAVGNGSDVWLHEMDRNMATRMTFEDGAEYYPVWSPDGDKIAYTSVQGPQTEIRVKSARGSGPSRSLWSSPNQKFTLDWSGPTGVVLFSEIRPQTKLDVFTVSPTGEGKPVALLDGPFNEQSAVFSPDGKYFAYVSDESGPYQVYVQSYPPGGAKWQISSSGGISPRWRKDGRELFYIQEGSLVAVEITPGPAFRAGIPTPLFPIKRSTDILATTERFAVSADGKRFLFARPPESSSLDALPTILFHALDAAGR